MAVKQRVLVVEDEEDLRSVVEYNLQLAGFETAGVATATRALEAVVREPPDLIILDLMLPDLPGTHVCRELRAGERTRSIPVLMLTAKGEERDRVTGLEVGADDYVVKPVSMRELVLRVRAILKRRVPTEAESGAREPAGGESGTEGLEAGPVRVDREAHQAYVDGRPVALTPLEFRLLATLVERRGRVQPRDDLLATVWQASTELTSRTVDTHVKRLRGKLAGAGAWIETVRGVGYRFRRET